VEFAWRGRVMPIASFFFVAKKVDLSFSVLVKKSFFLKA